MRLGNKKGNKRGAYIKLTGDEIITEHATHTSSRRARAFAAWFGENYERIRADLAEKNNLDDDVLNDTYILVYDIIAMKGREVVDFGNYFYRAYYTNNRKDTWEGEAKERDTARIDDPLGGCDLGNVEASAFDVHGFEYALDAFNKEVHAYVAEFYDAECLSLFEMYVGLYPEMSYKKLSDELGVPFSTVWQTLGIIKRDVVETFYTRKDQILKYYL